MSADLADAYIVRAEVYVAQGNVDKAIKDLETYIELTEDTSMYATVAQLQEASGDPEPVETEAAAEVSNLGAYYYRAVCEGAIGNLENALADYTVCIDNGYELTQSYYQRAQIYAALGDTENQNKDLAESLKYSE